MSWELFEPPRRGRQPVRPSVALTKKGRIQISRLAFEQFPEPPTHVLLKTALADGLFGIEPAASVSLHAFPVNSGQAIYSRPFCRMLEANGWILDYRATRYSAEWDDEEQMLIVCLKEALS
ncbi:MAG: hypothetical protein AAGN66_05585 [Acidobacteriota bacterium]